MYEFTGNKPWAHRASNMIWSWLRSDLLQTNGRPTSDADGHFYLILYGRFLKRLSAFLWHVRHRLLTLPHDTEAEPPETAVDVFVHAKIMLFWKHPNWFFLPFSLLSHIFQFKFVPCFMVNLLSFFFLSISFSGYWRSAKMLFHGQNFFLTETSEILASVQYRHTWPKTHSSIRIRAARFYLSILHYVIWEANIHTENYQTIRYKVEEIFNSAQTTHKFILTIFSCIIAFYHTWITHWGFGWPHLPRWMTVRSWKFSLLVGFGWLG